MECCVSKAPQTNMGECYAATCVLGSYDCPQVWTLRRCRDDFLDSTWCGRLLIGTYLLMKIRTGNVIINKKASDLRMHYASIGHLFSRINSLGGECQNYVSLQFLSISLGAKNPLIQFGLRTQI